MRRSGEDEFLLHPSMSGSITVENKQQHQTSSARGFFITLSIALGIFGVATGAARFFFPRGTGGRQPSALQGSFVERGDDGYETWECASNYTNQPVMAGVDLVSYFSLEAGGSALWGSTDHAAVFNGYDFWFVSDENKATFEAAPKAYIPAWGGFCSWGISNEDWWEVDNLGPDADPNVWLITDDGVLHFFRSELPRKKFEGAIAANIKAGNENWRSWWGDEEPGAAGTGAPLDTACFCDPDLCLDQ